MRPLTAGELNTLRGVITQTLAATGDLAQVTRRTSTKDASNNTQETWVTVGAPVAVQQEPAATVPAHRVLVERLEHPERAWLCTLPAQTDVAPEDRLTIGTALFEVVLTEAPRSQELSRRVLVLQVV